MAPDDFATTLRKVSRLERDAWLDRLLGVETIPDDGHELPRGSVPYLPCPVDAVLEAVVQTNLRASDVFVDVGAGVGRTALLAHLLTGARAIGLEIQPALVHAAHEHARRLALSRVTFIECDATTGLELVPDASVLFLYCPFGEPALGSFLRGLEPLARRRELRIACVDMVELREPWLVRSYESVNVRVYRASAYAPITDPPITDP